MSSPLHKHDGPKERLSGDGSVQARRHGRAFGSSYSQIFFVPPKFSCPQKICFKHMIKNKNIFPLKMYFSPPTLKPDYGPSSAKIVSAIRIFCFERHSSARCCISSKLFYKSPVGGSCKYFWGAELGCYGTAPN